MHLDIRYHLDLDTTEVDGKRHYVTPEGNIYPSMTTVLGRVPKEGLDQWRDKVGHDRADRIRDNAAEFGTAVHNLCEAYVMGREPPPSDPFQIARFRSIQPIIDSRFGAIYACETALYSDRLRLAGRTDVIGQFDGVCSVIDYKNAKRAKKPEWCHSYYHQESGYGFMWVERVGTADPTIIPKQLVTIVSLEHDQPQVLIQPIAPWFRGLQDILSVYH